MKRVWILMLAVVWMMIGSGCGTAEYRREEQYASSVRQLVDDAVKYTRILQEKDQKFQCYDSVSVKEYLTTLDKLGGIYQKLLVLQPSDIFDEGDRDLKDNVGQVLSVTSEIRSHVQYAADNADDTLFKKEKKELFEQYQAFYEGVTYSSQYIQTLWRNA